MTTVLLGQFLDAIAHRETGSYVDPYHHEEASGGAYGKYQFQPTTWETAALRFWGEVRDITSPTNQEQLATWRFLTWRDALHAAFGQEADVNAYQRLCVAWRLGYSVALRPDPTAFGYYGKKYSQGIGKWLTATFGADAGWAGYFTNADGTALVL